MAAEAVLKVKEAEDQAKEIIRAANENARSMLSSAEKDAAKQNKAILDEAARGRLELIAASTEKAERDCESLVADGIREREALLSPDQSKFKSAVQLIVERIVSGDGNH